MIMFGIRQAIFTEGLGMKSGTVKIVPKKLQDFEQKQHRMNIAQEMLMTMTFKPKPDHPNGSLHKKQDRKKHSNFGHT